MGLFVAQRFSDNVLEFNPVDKLVASLQLRFVERVLTVVYTYAPNSSSHFLNSLEKLLESALTEDLTILLGDFNGHVDNDSERWEE